MRRSSIWIAVLTFACSLACSPSQQNAKTAPDATGGTSSVDGGAGGAWSSPIPSASHQLITVISGDWQSVSASLMRYESPSWTPVGSPVSVVLGKNGLGWGLGLHPPGASGEPVKHEGDGRSPAGIFSLGTTFGYATPDAATWLKMPYLQATDDLECVDDPNSSHYNQLVYKSTISNVDWTSSEIMKRQDVLYRWGLFVEHNDGPPQAGAGSCIFLHTWSGPNSTTVGCTAGEENQMKDVYGWLDPEKHPVMVQLPSAVYAAHRLEWGLPEVSGG